MAVIFACRPIYDFCVIKKIGYDCCLTTLAMIVQENGTGADKIIMALRTACDKYEKLFAETNNVYDEIYHYVDEVTNYFIEIIEYGNIKFRF